MRSGGAHDRPSTGAVRKDERCSYDFVASLSLLAYTTSIHQHLPTPTTHSREATLPRTFGTRIAKKTRGRIKAACRFGAELATDHAQSLCQARISAYARMTLAQPGNRYRVVCQS